MGGKKIEKNQIILSLKEWKNLGLEYIVPCYSTYLFDGTRREVFEEGFSMFFSEEYLFFCTFQEESNVVRLIKMDLIQFFLILLLILIL